MAGIDVALGSKTKPVTLFNFSFPDIDSDFLTRSIDDIMGFDGILPTHGTVNFTMSFKDLGAIREFFTAQEVPLPLAQRCWMFFKLNENENGDLIFECDKKWVTQRIIESGIIEAMASE